MPIPSGATPAPTTEIRSFPTAHRTIPSQPAGPTFTWEARLTLSHSQTSVVLTVHHLNCPSVFRWWLSEPTSRLILRSDIQDIPSLLCLAMVPWETPPHLTTEPRILHETSLGSPERGGSSSLEHPQQYELLLQSFLPTALSNHLFFRLSYGSVNSLKTGSTRNGTALYTGGGCEVFAR